MIWPHDAALLDPTGDERPVVLIMHAINDLIRAGFYHYPDGREAIIHLLSALNALLELEDLGRLDQHQVQDFVTHHASTISRYDPERR